MGGAANKIVVRLRHAWRVRAFYIRRRRGLRAAARVARPERAAHARFIECGSPFAI